MARRRLRRPAMGTAALALALAVIAACRGGGGPTEPAPQDEVCGPYPDWESSPYVLPYPRGLAFVVLQGNCSVGSHRGVARYAYDFAMPLGTPVVASRAGEVVFAIDDRPDIGDPATGENVVIVLHGDGTRAFYSHLLQGGVEVEVGELVGRGQPLAASGNSGSTGGLPHLHFQVTPCSDRDACGTLPVTFSNTEPNPTGLEAGRVYAAG